MISRRSNSQIKSQAEGNIYYEINSNLFDHFFEFGNSGFGRTPDLVKAYTQASSRDCRAEASKLGIQEDDLNFYIHLDLPGVIKKDLNIEIKNSKLSICASHNKKVDVNRSITLGDLVLEEKVHAKLENGVLEVILPKVEKPKARLVPIA